MEITKKCSVPGCLKPAKSRGWCGAHYERWRKHGAVDASGPGGSKRNVAVSIVCEGCGGNFHPWCGRETTSKFCSVACNTPSLIQSVKRNGIEEFWSMVAKGDGCWEWQGYKRADGYGIFGYRGRAVRAHRFAVESARGKIPRGLFVCHSCDNPGCVNPAHLWLGSHRENLADMARKGRGSKTPSRHSEAHPLSKLTVEKVRAIREDPRIAKDIAAEYGVSRSLIYSVKHRQHWKRA